MTGLEALEGAPPIADVEVDPELVFGPVPRPDKLERTQLGRRARSLVARRAGKYSRHRLGPRRDLDLALDATLRAAAARTSRRGARSGGRLQVEPEDVRRKVRSHRSPLAVVFVVDNSYSVHAEHMVELVKGLALRLLEDAARRHDKVALVAFKGGLPEATVALPLTTSPTLGRRRLEQIPISGRTPLADALARAGRLLRQETFKHANAIPVAVIITDGLPTVALRPGGDAVADVLHEARELRRGRVFCVVADASPAGGRAGGCGPELARAGGGLYLPFAELAPRTLDALLDRIGDAAGSSP